MTNNQRRKRGKKIKDFRQSKDLTQEQFGKKLGYSRATILKIESGDANISLDFLDKMVEILGYEFNDMLMVEEDRPSYDSSTAIRLRAIEYKLDELTAMVKQLKKEY